MTSPKCILALSQLESSKTAVLYPLTSKSGQHRYEYGIIEIVDGYCSEHEWLSTRIVVLREIRSNPVGRSEVAQLLAATNAEASGERIGRRTILSHPIAG